MKNLSRFLVFALCLVGASAGAAPVATTAGSNLTAYNGNMGAINNNAWNNAMNGRSGQSGATADFGNCNAIVLRCAQPKCATGGCTSLEIARPIVSGCVQTNAGCAQYGDDLVEYISAQLVANSTAKANAQAAAAQTAAAQAAAAQSAQQLEQMQMQMQQMQQDMAAQNAQQMEQMQAALAEQKELTAQAIANANNATAVNAAATIATDTASAAAVAQDTVGALSAAQVAAANNGVSADVLAREQISGQIMSKIENAMLALKTVEAAMQNTFDYAGCDKNGDNCAGPKRVKAFKDRAMQFFDPYNDVLDELYDALIMAQSLGVDITDIYMMLNGTCNAWAQYLCSPGQTMHYTNKNCSSNGRSIADGSIRGGAQCQIGQVVPMSDGGCQLVKMLTNDDNGKEVQRNWLYPEQGSEGGVEVRVGCASEALENSFLFRNRKKQASIDIETLQRIIEQDAPQIYGTSRWGKTTTPQNDGVKFCAINEETLQDLQKVASLKQLPKKVCVTDTDLQRTFENNGGVLVAASRSDSNSVVSTLDCSNTLWKDTAECKCKNSGGTYYYMGGCQCGMWQKLSNGACVAIMADEMKNGTKSLSRYSDELLVASVRESQQNSESSLNTAKMQMCSVYKGVWNFTTQSCDCTKSTDFTKCFDAMK